MGFFRIRFIATAPPSPPAAPSPTTAARLIATGPILIIRGLVHALFDTANRVDEGVLLIAEVNVVLAIGDLLVLPIATAGGFARRLELGGRGRLHVHRRLLGRFGDR
jgi:hypothetical protein